MQDADRHRALDGVAAARQSLHQGHQQPTGTQPRPQPATDPAEAGTDAWTADRVAAELAEGAVRDQLARRIVELEQEVARLRRALSRVLEADAEGVRATEVGSDPDVSASRSGPGPDSGDLAGERPA